MTSASDPAAGVVTRERRPRGRTLLVAFVVLTALSVWRLRPAEHVGPYEFFGATMGTTFSVRVDVRLSPTEQDRIRRVVEERLDHVNGLMSTYDTASELSRFNRHSSTAPFPASHELLEVLALARDVSERSGGAFDVTVAPLVEAWGFGPSGVESGERTKPDTALLAHLHERVGYGKIALDPSGGTVTKAHPGMTIDLSAIAKGYGVERVAADLVELGYTRFLVEVGGELKAVGTTLEGRAWRVGVERPEGLGPALWGTVALTDEAIATSGDYRNYYEENGVRYAHIIDPRTGAPMRMRGTSVSVIHPNAAVADAWATALTVLGPDEGFQLARREGLAVLFLEPVAGGYRPLVTPTFDSRFVAEDLPR